MEEAIAEKLEIYFSQYDEKQAKKGAVLIQGHENPPGVMRLTRGAVAQYDIGKEGQKLVVNIFRPGAFFPMSWAINQQPNTYFFETLEDSAYRLAPADTTVAFLAENPDVLLDLLGRVYRGAEGLLKRMTYLMAGDARARLVLELLIVCQRFGRRQFNGSYEVAIKESDLAAYTGLSRETVSRTLQKLKEEGKLEQYRGKIIVPRLEDLEQSLGK